MQLKSVDQRFSRFSLEHLKLMLLKISYGPKNTLFHKLDPRILIGWYLIYAVTPWFTHNTSTLLLFAGYIAAMAALARVSGLIVLLMGISTFANMVYVAIVAFALGGNMEAFWALSTLTLKLLSVALASVAVFSGMDPERFSDTLLKLGLPPSFSFGVSYGYRMMPILVEEYNNIIWSYRIRGKGPERSGFMYWRKLRYLLATAVKAFYPTMLNTAKRTRTTVEALELKGFAYSQRHGEAKRLRLSYMRTTWLDWLFLAASIALAAAFMHIGALYPL